MMLALRGAMMAIAKGDEMQTITITSELAEFSQRDGSGTRSLDKLAALVPEDCWIIPKNIHFSDTYTLFGALRKNGVWQIFYRLTGTNYTHISSGTYGSTGWGGLFLGDEYWVVKGGID